MIRTNLPATPHTRSPRSRVVAGVPTKARPGLSLPQSPRRPFTDQGAAATHRRTRTFPPFQPVAGTLACARVSRVGTAQAYRHPQDRIVCPHDVRCRKASPWLLHSATGKPPEN